MSFRTVLTPWTAHRDHGPLPGILLLLTVGTGLVDAVTILGLGRVFVANMTGNVVFIGFALAGAPGFSLWGSVVALGAFLVGASLGGFLIARHSGHRGHLLRTALVTQTGLVALAVVLAAVLAGPAEQLLVLAAVAVALGVQNSVVRHLAVPDMTTTVLTMTLTGIAADLRERDLATAGRRAAAVLGMLLGALAGALLVLRLGVDAGLVAVLVVTVVALLVAARTGRGRPDWAVARAAGGGRT